MSGTVMPLDAALVTLGDINRGDWPEQFGKRPGTIFSYMMNNYWDTNYRAAQGGHFQFHYVITSAPSIDASSLSQMGWEEITPLEVDTVTTQDKAIPPSPQNPPTGGLDGKEQSFVDVSDPNILLEAWKAAEDGDGTILRFLDLGGVERAVTVEIPLMDIRSATQTDSVERNSGPLTLQGPHGFKFTIHHNEIVTVRVTGPSGVQKPGS
jgi:alpha-mannosidase